MRPTSRILGLLLLGSFGTAHADDNTARASAIQSAKDAGLLGTRSSSATAVEPGWYTCDGNFALAGKFRGTLQINVRLDGNWRHESFVGSGPRDGAEARNFGWEADSKWSSVDGQWHRVSVTELMAFAGTSRDSHEVYELRNPFEPTAHPLQKLSIVAEGRTVTMTTESWDGAAARLAPFWRMSCRR